MRRLFLSIPLALSLSCSTSYCECVSEGTVHFTISDVTAAEGSTFVSGAIVWEACCEPEARRDGIWKVDTDTGEVTPAEVPQGAQPVGYQVPFPNGVTLVLSPFPQDSVNVQRLEIGRLVGPGPSPGMDRAVLLDVTR